MDNRTIFLYWVGKEYKLISIFRELMYLHSKNGKGYNVVLITDSNIQKYIPHIPDYFSRLCPAHQADFVRVHVICEYGGIWLDSDTLVLDSLDSLFDTINDKNGFFIKQNNTCLWNGVFGSKKQTPLMIEWKTRMMSILNVKKETIEWCEIGNGILGNIKFEKPALYENYQIFDGLDNMYPVNFDKCVSEYINKPYDNYKTIVRKYQPLVVLVNSVYKALEEKPKQSILNGNIPLNYFIQTSYSNSYIHLIQSDIFNQRLTILNTALKKSLDIHNVPCFLIGNLFYDHEQPRFYQSPLLADCCEKRIRLFNAAKRSTVMFEIGLNGGHSAFLSLMSNNTLTVYSNDIAEPYLPCHPEIYVPVAADTLKQQFHGRFHFIKGSCLIEVPRFVQSQPHIQIDLVHIDGAKHTYKEDFFNIMPLLNDKALIVFDDSNLDSVQQLVDELIRDNYIHRSPDFAQMDSSIKYRNEILVYNKYRNKLIFDNIYKNKIWNNGNINIPLSGPGSSIENTQQCSQLLNDFIYNHHCSSVLDLGCGDLNWISQTPFFKDMNIKYTGIDVVDTLIQSHAQKYPNKHFICQDITQYKNIDFASIIVIRDVIFHLQNVEILKIFENIKNKFDYILITSCKNNTNTDIFDRWRFSQKNIHKEPFNKSYDFQKQINEDVFNRNMYIYTHASFYRDIHT